MIPPGETMTYSCSGCPLPARVVPGSPFATPSALCAFPAKRVVTGKPTEAFRSTGRKRSGRSGLMRSRSSQALQAVSNALMAKALRRIADDGLLVEIVPQWGNFRTYIEAQTGAVSDG